MAGSIRGELAAIAQDQVGVVEEGGTERPVVLPTGYEFHRILGTVTDESGAAVATVGDFVELGGGETGSDGAWALCAGTVVVITPAAT